MTAIQALFDEDREAWKAEVEISKENRQNFEKTAAQRQAPQEKDNLAEMGANVAQKGPRLQAARRWFARPYKLKCNNKNGPTQRNLHLAWRAKYPMLSFPYSGAEMPQPKDFSTILHDYLDDPHRHAHHMLAYLQHGYGHFQCAGGGTNTLVYHPYMSLSALARIHGQECTSLRTSHQCAIEEVKQLEQKWAEYRLARGI